jgi:hypothetical protein
LVSYFIIKLLHVFAMAIWTGGPLVALIGVREDFAEGGTRALAALARLQKMTRLFIVAALTTVASGATLIALAGGPTHVGHRYLAGGALSLPIFVIGGAVVRPALSRLEAHFRDCDPPAAAAPAVRRFFLAARSEDVLRTIVLMLMILPLF